MRFEEPGPTHVVAHISDTHLLGGDRKLFGSLDVKANLEGLLGRLTEGDQQIDALVFTGDIADIGEREAYSWIKATVDRTAAELGAKVVWVMGNHDERAPFAKELLGTESDGAPLDQVYDLNGLRLIVMDTTVPGYHHGHLDSNQLDWLKTQLAQPSDHGSVIAVHHPPIRSHIPYARMIELVNMFEFEEVIRGSDVRAVLGGHLHYSTFGLCASIPVSVASATCYTVDTGANKAFLMSSVDGGQSTNLVHFYPDNRVVHSIVPAAEYPQLAGYPAGLRQLVETMSEEQLIEMVSNKKSEFNRKESALSADESA
jgi:3',5'-cyclic AMP phosphodiesterase CpdA